jgi:ribonuclease-3
VLAECCEALVGALYRLGGGSRGGLELVLRWLEPAWERTSAELLADPDRHNWKTALQEWSQGHGLGLPHYRCEEMSRRHGDPRRFRARVQCGSPHCPEGGQAGLELPADPEAQATADGSAMEAGGDGDNRPSAHGAGRTPRNLTAGCSGEGWGGSRREAEQQAARAALAAIRRP